MIPDKGIYVFYESGKPLYVGRSDRMRGSILEHGRPSSLHNSATFAFLLAMKTATYKAQLYAFLSGVSERGCNLEPILITD